MDLSLLFTFPDSKAKMKSASEGRYIMNSEKWIIAHFSPIGGTKKASDAIAAGFNIPVAEMDLTTAKELSVESITNTVKHYYQHKEDGEK